MMPITRVRRSTREARRAYNRLSRWYDVMANASEGPPRDLGLQMLAAQPGERILEIGFGTGHGLVSLLQAVLGGYVVGVDISEGMAAMAGRRLAQMVCAAGVGLALADGARLPFAPGSFDAVFMSFTLELFDTPLLPVVLASCHEVLRPTGRLGIVALTKEPGGGRLPVRLYELAHRLMPRWVDCRPIHVAPLLRSHGFHVTAATRTAMWGLPVDVVLASAEVQSRRRFPDPRALRR